MTIPIYDLMLKSIHPDGMGGLDFRATFGDEIIEGTLCELKGKTLISGKVSLHGRERTQTKDALKDAETVAGITQIDVMHIRLAAEMAKEEEMKLRKPEQLL